jgi:hypothetical protein
MPPSSRLSILLWQSRRWRRQAPPKRQ